MRREKRKKEGMDTQIIKLASIGVAILTVIVIALLIYGSKLNKEVKNGSLSREQLANLVNKTSDDVGNTERTSTEMGKTVEEAKNAENNQSIENQTGNTNTSVNETKNNSANTLNNVKGTTTKETKKNTTNKMNTTNIVGNSSKTTTIQETKKSEDSKNINEKGKNEVQNGTKELSFAKPVDGDIVKEFAKDNLLFSQTLQEWTVHTGVDIKAEKTTVVKASEAGTVKSIKNDPRYGLTIVILHDNGFETVYSNLLTSEFVVEGEKVGKWQSIGTVGNTAAFEVADDSHLHFEILKDSIQVDPSIYLK